ncbi:MAG: GTP 3',8-cyclase MoaA [Betaproteobacteria bacterium]|uniref:GTP 3',8-cyclase n=1 Tax=Candidatus Proximibacter danicus TaxID=2954365 RepID=A0A9D7K4K1_9PROT|nr:GTP 3',8-cyclase MoaA [Candidatus Proximibacter danicus]
MRNESLNPHLSDALPDELAGFRPTTTPETSRHAEGTLIDKYGRHITYIRLSITDRCDFRCTYCMAEDMEFLPREQVLSLEECLRIVRTFVGMGVTKVRITGGEPLVRRNALWLMEQIAVLEGMKELVITTNGSQLDRYAVPLMNAGVKRINISLDTLKPERFKAITRIGDLDKVLRGIEATRTAGFTRTKLNTVMMRSINDDEFIDLVRYATERDLNISFIEEMPLGDVGRGRGNTYFSSAEALKLLAGSFELQPTAESTGGPARYWRVQGSDSRVGFISPHSHNFCDTCNRVRITAQGELYPCLGQNDAMSLMPLLRENTTDEPLREAIVRSMGIKPKEHNFTEQLDAPKVVRFMSMTGG